MSDVTISPAGLRVMKLLVGNPPQAVSDLIRATGVTRTAVTEQLSELAATGFVERATERLPGRGRPRHLYKATDAAMVLLMMASAYYTVRALERASGKWLAWAGVALGFAFLAKMLEGLLVVPAVGVRMRPAHALFLPDEAGSSQCSYRST